VIVLARPDRYHPFHRIAVVTAKPRRAARPASAYSVWQQAWSKPFRVRIGR
jgi:hypothetical protein